MSGLVRKPRQDFSQCGSNYTHIYLFQITIPSGYEDDAPPEVFCITDIYHPNIDTLDMFTTSSPNVCLNLLDSGKWRRKFGLEAAVLGLVFLLHNPNLSEPLFGDIDRDMETFENNVKKYMNGEDIEGRTFAADFLKDLQVQNTQDESTDKLINPSKNVDNINEDDISGIQSCKCINIHNEDNEVNALLGELKQLAIDDEKETINDNAEGACTMISLANDTVLVPYESAEIIKDIGSASKKQK